MEKLLKIYIMKKLMIVIGASLMLFSCGGGADCSCNEIVKKSGKWYRSGIYKDGDRASFGELFTGSCESLDGEGNPTMQGEYNNGYRNSLKEWKREDGELYLVKDVKFKNGEVYEGYSIALNKDYGYVYLLGYYEYKEGKEVLHYSTNSSVTVEGENGDSFNIPSIDEGGCYHGYSASNEEMKEFLDCVSKINLPKFFYKELK